MPRPRKNRSINRDFSAKEYQDFLNDRYEKRDKVLRKMYQQDSKGKLERFADFVDRGDEPSVSERASSLLGKVGGFAGKTVSFFDGIGKLLKLAFWLFVLYKCYQMLFGDNSIAKQHEGIMQARKDLDIRIRAGKPPLKDDMFYRQIAGNLHALFSSDWSGTVTTNEVGMYLDQLPTYSDWLKLYIVFGVQSMRKGLSVFTPNLSDLLPGYYDLPHMIQHFSSLNADLPEYFDIKLSAWRAGRGTDVTYKNYASFSHDEFDLYEMKNFGNE